MFTVFQKITLYLHSITGACSNRLHHRRHAHTNKQCNQFAIIRSRIRAPQVFPARNLCTKWWKSHIHAALYQLHLAHSRHPPMHPPMPSHFFHFTCSHINFLVLQFRSGTQSLGIGSLVYSFLSFKCIAAQHARVCVCFIFSIVLSSRWMFTRTVERNCIDINDNICFFFPLLLIIIINIDSPSLVLLVWSGRRPDVSLRLSIMHLCVFLFWILCLHHMELPHWPFVHSS